MLQKKAAEIKAKDPKDRTKADWKDLKKYQKATQKFFENWQNNIKEVFGEPLPSEVAAAVSQAAAVVERLKSIEICIAEQEKEARKGLILTPMLTTSQPANPI
ncbi:MAG: hypothetical protein MUF12_10155 [Sediminibacterium sp.]|nr:hypothetical protein [Sediminibacterium sp.]